MFPASAKTVLLAFLRCCQRKLFKLCKAITFVKLYTFMPVSVALTNFQGDRIVSENNKTESCIFLF